ncbi:twin-arginine translocation signal domain-containing protein [Gordonibacter sp.]|uniref:twin-arginine translocation signal domain-containing protein n=1 Tax=Gordonibacter sp. TaxID=1968902 RepID=UPI002FC7CF0B
MKRYSLDDFPYFSDRGEVRSVPEHSCGTFSTEAIYDEPDKVRGDVTRRDFLKMMGVAGVMGLVPWRGTLVQAYADEQGETAYTITVFKRWEIPIIFYDVSTSPHAPVGSATMNVHSWSTGKDTGALVANQEGYVVLDARSMCEKPNDDGTYSFSGSLLVSKAGYRTYETGLAHFTSGVEVDAATEPDDGTPYLQCVTFDDWDIQYAKQTGFTRSVPNDADHTFLVKLAGGNLASSTVTVYQASGHEVGSVSPNKNADGTYTAQFTGRYLGVSKEACLDADSPVFIKVVLGSSTLTATTTMVVEEAFFETAVMRKKTDADIFSWLAAVIPTKDEIVSEMPEIQGSGISIHIPNTVPVLGGQDVSLPIPGCFVSLSIDPSGLYMLMVEYSGSKSLYETGRAGAGDWKTANAKNTWDKALTEFNDYRDTYSKDNLDWLYNPPQSKKFFGNFDFTLSAGLGIVLRKIGTEADKLKEAYPGFDYLLEGGLVGYVSLGLSFTYTWQFFISGFFPVFIQFGFALNSKITVEGQLFAWKHQSGEMYPLGITPNKTAVPDASGLVWKSDLGITLSIGIGIAGVASVSLRGCAMFIYTLSYFFHDPYKGTTLESSHGNPRHRVVFSLGVDICVQILLFKFSCPLAYGSWTLADSWSAASQEASLDDLSTMAQYPALHATPDGHSSSKQLFGQGGAVLSADDFVMVTQEELLGCAEFAQSGANPFILQEGAAGTEVEEPVFEHIEGRGATYLSHPSLASAVAGRGEEAAQPVETLAYSNVFSNPRMQIVSFKDKKFLLRILPVKLADGTSRTRLTIASYAEDKGCWTEGVVVENGPYRWAENRANLYDYDFAVEVLDPYNGHLAYMWDGIMRVVLVSGTRPGNAGDLGEAAGFTVLSVLEIDESYKVKQVLSTKTFEGFSGDSYRMVSQPFVSTCSVIPDDEKILKKDSGYATVAGAFVRTAASARALVEGPYLESPVLWSDRNIGGAWKSTVAFFSLTEKATEKAPASFADGRMKSDLAFIVQPASSIHTLRLAWFYTIQNADGTSAGRLLTCSFDADKQVNGDGLSGIMTTDYTSLDIVNAGGVQPWYTKIHHDEKNGIMAYDERVPEGFLVSGGTNDDPVLMRLVVAADGSATQTEVSLENKFKLGKFALSLDGNTVFYAVIRDGKEPETYDPLGNKIAGKEVKEYAICAQTCVYNAAKEYRFTKPFTLCHLAHPVDSFVAIEAPDSYCFLFSQITDLSKSLSDIYYCTLPKILGATITGFGSVHRFVCAGSEEPFYVNARNDGNKITSAFDLRIATVDGTYSSTVHLDLASKEVSTIVGLADGGGVGTQSSGDAPSADPSSGEVAPPSLSAVAEAGALLPTEERRYEFKWSVPESWEGDVDLEAQVVPGSVKLSTVPVAAEIENEDALLQASGIPTLSEIVPARAFVDIYAESAGSMSMVDTVQKSSYAWSGSQGNGPSGGGTAPDKSGTVATSDSFGPLAAIAAVASVAGAGLAVYSTRRKRIEEAGKDEGR